MKRLFLAISLPDGMIDAFEETMAPYKKDQHLKDAKWVSRENYHVTVLFLGDIVEAHLAEMQTILRGIANRISPFSLYFEHIEFFSYKMPKMIWGRFQRSLAFLELHKESKKFMKPYMDEDDDKEPIPHVTLARLRHPIDPKKFSFKPLHLPPLEVTQLQLYESELTERGPIYTLLDSYELQG